MKKLFLLTNVVFLLSTSTMAADFFSVCKTATGSARNTVDILMESVGVSAASDAWSCSLATNLLKSKTDIKLGATKFTPPFENRPLNPVTDLSPLGHLSNLKELNLRIYGKLDMTPISRLSSLETLSLTPDHAWLDKPDINLKFLRKLKNLKKLTLNNISLTESDFEAIGSVVSLQVFDVNTYGGETCALDKLSGLVNLTNLKLLGCASRNLNALAKMSVLHELTLSGSDVEDIQGIAGLTNLKILYIGMNDAKMDISPIASLKALEHLSLGNNKIQNLSPLANLQNLKYLSIHNNQVRDISALANLSNLETVYLGGNRIEDLRPLANLQKLRLLHIVRNPISKLSGIEGLANLETLDVSQNRLVTIEELVDLKKIKTLNLGENQIEDISALEGLKIESLTIHYNRILSLEPLAHMLSLTRLSVNGNMFTTFESLKNLVNLESLFAYSVHANDFNVLDPLVAEHANSSGKKIKLRVFK